MAQCCWKCGAASPAPFTDSPPVVMSLKLTHLLASNEPALDSEIPIIRSIISDGEQQMGALDAQIQRLQVSLEQLAQRRDEIAERIRQHRAAISSVRRVPPELICEIFSLTVSGRILQNKNRASGSKPPWHLGHICGSWRQAALSYTPFWSSIAVPSSLSSDTHLSRIEAQLLRAVNAPLEIYWSKVTSNVDSRLLDLVLPECSRWRTLRLDFAHSSHVLNWLLPVNGHLHSLENLEVVDGFHSTLPDVFSDTANLRQVILTTDRFLPSPISPALPWSQITHYRGAYTLTRQLDILSYAPHLLECVLGFIHDYSFITSHVVLPDLRRLCVEDDAILAHLTAPLLEDLTVVWFSSTLLPFVHRSSCTLTKLVLTRCTVSPELTTALENLPSLTHLLLAVDDEESDEEADEEAQTFLFSAMSSAGSASDMCPNLTLLAFGYVSSTPWDSFFTMAQSRFQREASRFSLRIFNPGDLTIDAPKGQVRMLQDAGMDIGLLDSDDMQEAMSLFCRELLSVVLEH
ncbi:hypothetical protein B0H19DRAFT_985709 [Mycena capillaripes]|nr:hypothetical protein B0H19DRAFT_985709 [Mycena capillaripes]